VALEVERHGAAPRRHQPAQAVLDRPAELAAGAQPLGAGSLAGRLDGAVVALERGLAAPAQTADLVDQRVVGGAPQVGGLELALRLAAPDLGHPDQRLLHEVLPAVGEPGGADAADGPEEVGAQRFELVVRAGVGGISTNSHRPLSSPLAVAIEGQRTMGSDLSASVAFVAKPLTERAIDRSGQRSSRQLA
jgi:hypothetical protein